MVLLMQVHENVRSSNQFCLFPHELHKVQHWEAQSPALGRINPMYQCPLGAGWLENILEEKELEVLVDTDVSHQCHLEAKSTSSVLG